jgi:hypothetical protein
VEVLVHVTAPGLVADDATYRQLAYANLNFRPDIRMNISSQQMEEATGADTACARREGGTVEARLLSPRMQYPAPSFHDSQDLSFEDAWDNRSSPRFREHIGHAGGHVKATPPPRGAADTQESWRAPPSQISDSYPLPAGPKIYISPTRIMQQYLPRASSSVVAASFLASSRTKEPTSEPGVPQARIDVPSSLPVPSQNRENKRPEPSAIVPVTPAVTRPKVDSENITAQEDTTMGLDVTHVSSSDISVPAIQSAIRSESAPALFLEPHEDDDRAIIQTSCRRNQSSSDVRAVPDSSSAAGSLQALEIRSPSPPVGVQPLDAEGLITKRLAELPIRLRDRYEPEMAREVLPLERGYWLVDCSMWTRETRNKAWVFLSTYIGNGLAGWGVWCRRDEEFTSIRLYCWGYILEHVYLLVYLVSDRRLLKKTGAAWIGGDGEIAVHVHPLAKREREEKRG